MATHWTVDEVCDLVAGDQDFYFAGSDDDFGMGDLEDYDPLQRKQGRYKQRVQQIKNSFHHNMQF